MQYSLKTWFFRGQAEGKPYNYAKKIPGSTITVPVPNHNEIRSGTLQSIIKQSGIQRTEFE